MRPLVLCTLAFLVACGTEEDSTDQETDDTVEDTEDTEDTDPTDTEDTDEPDDTDTMDTDDTDEPAVELVTAVRFLHLLQGMGSFDVYLGEATTPLVTALDYRDPSDFLELAAGTHTLNVRLNGAPASTPAALSITVDLPEEDNLLVVAWPNIPGYGGVSGGPDLLTEVIDLTATPGHIEARVTGMYMSDDADLSHATNAMGMWGEPLVRTSAFSEVHELPNAGGRIGLSTDYEANVSAYVLTEDFADASVMVIPPTLSSETPLAVHSFGDDPVELAPAEGTFYAVNLAHVASSGFAQHTYTVTGLGENAGTWSPNTPTKTGLATNLTVGDAQGPGTLPKGRQWFRVRRDLDGETDDVTYIDNAPGTRTAYLMDGHTFFEGGKITLPGDWIRPASGMLRMTLTGQVSYNPMSFYVPNPNGGACTGWEQVSLSPSARGHNHPNDWSPTGLEIRSLVDGVYHSYDLSGLPADSLYLLAQRNETLVVVDEYGLYDTIEGTVSTNPCATP